RSKPVVTIADRRKLHVELHLPLTEFGAVKPGSLLSLQADEPVKSSLQGRVTVVSSYVNSSSRTFRVQLEIENGNEQLPAGFTVRHSGTR
ncbi:MAG: efflux RND transporter periplasmic adaptor subunit, partial [Planctomycetota bacterium]|nr:efflux RND transporter periplasmic adaptor subunit [Planctomycetota bacterium]